ncbi:hypothetical protein ES332_A01G120700v1 [Gossypium tomentosum]|uniref:RNase H type-1 domain-containing protein n=1 Tax=Gossypium tomentosum TaxID=34277 RepID=A0A5D2RPL9_GOSTO|nr:hypothetical protein ES332_A01G120700v1 [Gossypium tomentosum]
MSISVVRSIIQNTNLYQCSRGLRTFNLERYSCFLNHTYIPYSFTAEATAVIHALWFVENLGFAYVEIEGDLFTKLRHWLQDSHNASSDLFREKVICLRTV